MQLNVLNDLASHEGVGRKKKMLSAFFQLQTLRTDQLITLPFLVCRSFLFVVLCWVLVFVFFGLFFLFWLCFFFWHRDS